MTIDEYRSWARIWVASAAWDKPRGVSGYFERLISEVRSYDPTAAEYVQKCAEAEANLANYLKSRSER